MKPAVTFAWLCAAALSLAACGGKQDADRQGTAGGEILKRSVGDDMLPYDTVRSQPPLAPKAVASGKKDGQSADEQDEAGGAAAGDAASQGGGEAGPAGNETATPAAE